MKGGGQRVVISMEDTAHLGCWESGMCHGAELHDGTIPGIGFEAG